MILSIDELKKYIKTTEQDEVLEAKLQALESFVRKRTNNDFRKPNIRTECQVMSQKLYTDYQYFALGDTVQISGSIYNDGLYVVKGIEDDFIELNEPLLDESNVFVAKVVYPMDVKMGIVEMLKWNLENGSKIGIQSETISRHSVTYYDISGDNFNMGYPKSLLGFLKPYMKARF